MKVIVDTREQHPLKFSNSNIIEGTVIRKLDVGDYSIEGLEDKIAIERKSPQDLFGTLGKGHKRFKAELERAKSLDYFGIVVEAPFLDVYQKSFKNSHYSQMRGDVIIKQCCTIEMKYPNVRFWFCNSRAEATTLIRNIFKSYEKREITLNKPNKYEGEMFDNHEIDFNSEECPKLESQERCIHYLNCNGGKL